MGDRTIRRDVDRRRVMQGIGAMAGGLTVTGLAGRSLAQTSPAAPAIARGTTVTVSVWGGVSEDFLKKYVEPEFTKQTGAKIAYDIGAQGVRLNKLIAQRTSPTTDVVFLGDQAIIAGYRAGVLTPANRAGIPRLAELHDWSFGIKEYATDTTIAAIPYTILANVIAYNPEVIKNKPTSWADLWRPEVQGKLMMPGLPASATVPLVMIANELAGGPPSDLSAGIKKLAELKPVKLSLFWTDWAPQSKTGDIIMGVELDYYVETMKDQKYPVDYVFPKEKAIGIPQYLSLVKGTKNQEAAEAFINLMISAKVQEDMANTTQQGVINKTVQLSPAMANRCSCGARLEQLRFFDPRGIADIQPKLIEQLNTEVVPKWGVR